MRVGCSLYIKEKIMSCVQQVGSGVSAAVREIGFVKKLVLPQGYGFIRPEKGGEDVFVSTITVQQSGIVPFEEGAKVSYQAVEVKGRFRAINLELINDEISIKQSSSFPDPDQWIDGILKWFSPAKGYGFVSFVGGAKDAFLTKQVFVSLTGVNEQTRVENLSVKVLIVPGKKPGLLQVKAIARS